MSTFFYFHIYFLTLFSFLTMFLYLMSFPCYFQYFVSFNHPIISLTFKKEILLKFFLLHINLKYISLYFVIYLFSCYYSSIFLISKAILPWSSISIILALTYSPTFNTSSTVLILLFTILDI